MTNNAFDRDGRRNKRDDYFQDPFHKGDRPNVDLRPNDESKTGFDPGELERATGRASKNELHHATGGDADFGDSTGNSAGSANALRHDVGDDNASRADTARRTGDEEGASLFDKEGNEGDAGFPYRQEGPSRTSKIKGRLGKLGRRRGLVIGTAAGGMLLLALFVIFLLTIGSLLIPNFAQDMVAYDFARVARETTDSNAEVTSEKIGIDSASDTGFRAILNKYKNLKNDVWTNINKYRPEKVVQNLRAEGQLDFTYSPPSGPLGRRTLQEIIVNGNAIDVPQNSTSALDKLLHPIDYTRRLWRSNKALTGALTDTLDTTMRGTNWIIRSKVAGIIRDQRKIKLFRWSDQDIAKSRGEGLALLDEQNAQQSYSIATEDGQAAAEGLQGTTSDVQSAGQDAQKTIDECVQNTKCLDGVINSGNTVPSTTASVLNKAFSSSALTTALKLVGPTYAIAVPLCLIYEGSVVKSNNVINANTNADERIGNSVASAADQQKAGNVDPGEVGSLTRQFGNGGEIARTTVLERASGVPINTTNSGVSPQKPPSGRYSYNVFDFLPGPVDSTLTHIINPLCKVFDNPFTGVVIGIASIILPATRAVLAGAETVTLATIGSILTQALKNLGSALGNLFTKTELLKIGAIGGATIAGAVFAKWVTIQHMGAINNGLAQKQTYAAEADAGMIANGQDLDRQQNMAAPMTTTGTMEAKKLDIGYVDQQQQSKSAFQRYFAIHNPTSLVTKMGTLTLAHMSFGSVSSIIASATRIFNPLTAFSSIFNVFRGTTAAAAATNDDTSDYGIVQVGWTPIEESHYLNDPNYSMLYNQQQLDNSGQESAIASKYGKCFTDQMGDLLGNGDIRRENTPNGNVITDAGDCAPDNLGPTNQDDPNVTDDLVFKDSTAQLVFRWRVAKRNQNSLNALTDTQNAPAPV